MSEFYSAVFEGDFEETKQYLAENFKDCKWDCPIGEENLEGIIDVLDSGAHQPGMEEDVAFEVDYSGNIRCKGDMEAFANIVESNLLKEYRINLGLTQKGFSELFNPPIPVSTIKKWDSGKMSPPDWVEGLIIEKLERMKGQ